MNLGMSEMIFIALLALVVVGPKRLPELARQLGKYMAEFKRASNEFKHQLEAEMLNIELEERAKKEAAQPQILPPEELYQPDSPPPGAISRGFLDAEPEEPPALTGTTPAQEAPVGETGPSTPHPTSPNA